MSSDSVVVGSEKVLEHLIKIYNNNISTGLPNYNYKAILKYFCVSILWHPGGNP